MQGALLISSAYIWFIGLLVMMIVMAVLFVVIAVATARPIKIDEGVSDAKYTKSLLAKREAELLSEYQSVRGNAEAENAVMAQLRDVSAAERLVAELVAADNGVEETAGYADDELTAEEAAMLESDESVAIEQTFSVQESEGLKKSFSAKLIQSADAVKVWYFEVKNCLLCYEKTKASMHWSNEKFYIGKKNVATLAMRGKTLCLYLALNPDEYSDSYEVKPTASPNYEKTPCLFRVKGSRGVKQAKELIALLMADYGVMYVKTNHSIYALPYEDDDALVAKGLAHPADGE